MSALLCAIAIFAAGCSNHNQNSGYAVTWVTLTDDPGDFASYIVNVDSVTFTQANATTVTALGTLETVDFTKLGNMAELWGSASIPAGTYTSASIVLDYTQAVVTVMVNGLPVKATLIDPATGVAPTMQTINVILDPAYPLTLQTTYATTAAQRIAISVNLAASTSAIDLTTSPPTVTVKPYVTASIAPPDNKIIRVRGPLINTSVDLETYTVYVRPFYDESSSLGLLSLFATPDTVYTIYGTEYTGSAGINHLSLSSAGTTITAGWVTYAPTATPTATAGIFTLQYVVAGSSLEDQYTQGIEGDVIARVGNTVTLRGATLQYNSGASGYFVADSTLILGPNTLVTADDNTSLPNLNYTSIAVGQHVIARGIASVSTDGLLATVDATGDSSTNTGSVRLITTNLWGSLITSSAGSVLLNLSTIDNWPVTNYSFAGNGASAAADPTAANFLVNTGAVPLPAAAVGDPLYIDGIFARFGTAPPAFNATAVNSELSVQKAGGVAPSLTCGQANQSCEPASMRVYWTSPGAGVPFIGLTAAGMSIDLANPSLNSAIIRIGPEIIDMKTLPASPVIIATVPLPPVTATAPGSGSVPQTLPPLFLPEYSFGNPAAVAPLGISVFSAFGTFATGVTAALAATPALQLEARGTYNRVDNTFTAISVNVVL